jgi:hypothetical protein
MAIQNGGMGYDRALYEKIGDMQATLPENPRQHLSPRLLWRLERPDSAAATHESCAGGPGSSPVSIAALSTSIANEEYPLERLECHTPLPYCDSIHLPLHPIDRAYGAGRYSVDGLSAHPGGD